MNIDPATRKIVKKHKDKFVIFYSEGCPYCDRAIELVKNLPHRKYNIEEIIDNVGNLVEIFKKTKSLTGFDPNHKTKPIIFYRGKFIGGSNELEKYLKK